MSYAEVEIFDPKRIYDDSDPELNIIAGKSKRAQWRHRRVGPAFIKFGRRVKYAGVDLNTWIDQNRILPTNQRRETVGGTGNFDQLDTAR